MKLLEPIDLDESCIYTPIWDEAPHAPVRLAVERGIWHWIAIRCPYCGEQHQHGGEIVRRDVDPRSLLGGRLAHCRLQPWSLHSIEYRLIALDGAIARHELDAHFPRVDVGWDTTTHEFVDFRHERKRRINVVCAADIPDAAISTETRQPISRTLRTAVWQKAFGHCWYCGDRLNPFENFHVDHVHPVVDGGRNELTNLVPSCQRCNLEKGAASLEMFRQRRGNGLFWFEIARISGRT